MVVERRGNKSCTTNSTAETITSLAMQDLDNTVGAWDMYGQEDTKRYPDMQNEFFERAAGGLASRGSMLRFCAVGALLKASGVGCCRP